MAAQLQSITFPQGPIFDPGTQQLSIEWFMFLQNLPLIVSAIVDDVSISSIFTSGFTGQISTIAAKLDALSVALANMANPSAQVSTLSKKIDAINSRIAMQSQFNPGSLQKRIDAIETMGVFV